jgi:hypothetical protein
MATTGREPCSSPGTFPRRVGRVVADIGAVDGRTAWIVDQALGVLSPEVGFRLQARRSGLGELLR